MSRNTTFESENVSVVARRGHVMFMHNDDVHVASAGFYGLGRTDKRRPIDDPVNQPDPDNPGTVTSPCNTAYYRLTVAALYSRKRRLRTPRPASAV